MISLNLYVQFSYLTERIFQVHGFNENAADTIKSNLYKIEAGVPQASFLAPMLFNIYLADVPVSPNQSSGKILMFVDDTLLYSQGRIWKNSWGG